MVFEKGNSPWNKGKKGLKAWNKGKKCPQISKALIGTKRPDLVERNKQRRKEKIKVKCLCGKEFYTKQPKAKYCSQKCYHKFTNHNRAQGKNWKLSKETKEKLRIVNLREKNPHWKGGYIKRGKFEYELLEFKKNVFKRDKYLCQICGETGRMAKLNAHHLNSINKFPEQGTDINNGITLCQKCHRKFHNKFGYGNNTKKQFKEFTLETIKDIQMVKINKSTIYNLTLEGEDTFFANGILTHNTPPHIIRPKNKKALKFELGKKARLEGKKKGKTIVFAKRVKHPGTRPNPFIRNTLQTKLRKIIIEEINHNI